MGQRRPYGGAVPASAELHDRPGPGAGEREGDRLCSPGSHPQGAGYPLTRNGTHTAAAAFPWKGEGRSGQRGE